MQDDQRARVLASPSRFGCCTDALIYAVRGPDEKRGAMLAYGLANDDMTGLQGMSRGAVQEFSSRTIQMIASPISWLRIDNVTSTTNVGTYAGERRLIYLVETGVCPGKDEDSLKLSSRRMPTT